MSNDRIPRAGLPARGGAARDNGPRRSFALLPRRVPFAGLSAALLGVLALSACGTSLPTQRGIEPRPLGRDLPSFQVPEDSHAVLPGAGAANAAEFPAPTGALRLQEALATALMHNPELAAFGWNVRAAQARILQASLRPNPELQAQGQSVSATGLHSGLSPLTITAMISQPILTGGEIAKRTRVAQLERDLAAWDYEAKRLDVFTEVVQRFVGVLAGQRRLAVAERTFELANQVYQTVSRQVAAGAVSPIEQTRAKAERALNRIGLQRAKRRLEAARQALAKALGLAEPTFEEVVGELARVQPVPPLEILDDFLSQNPAVARWETVLAERRAEIELAEAEGLPDVTPGIGVLYLPGFDFTAGVVSLSMPLPLFDRNQGNIQAARAELMQARQQRRAAIVRVRAALGQRYQTLQAALAAATGLAEQALPAARSAYEAVLTAYRRGERGFLDVLIAQRTLFELKTRYVEVLAEYHRTAAAVERLIARPLSTAALDGTARPEDGNSAEEEDTP
ncbi:MAG: TolC family protein [Nitrococcus sp.]|nr:TolC family protein [Nitrococcus sp.]